MANGMLLSRKTLTPNRHPQAGVRPVGPGEGPIVVGVEAFTHLQ